MRSYNRNRSALEEIVLSREFDIIAVTETWCPKKIKLPTGEYEVSINPAAKNRGSGLALITRKKLIIQQQENIGDHILMVKIISYIDVHTYVAVVYA